LKRILESRAFHSSKRSQQFLSYVVRQALEGRSEQLKEQVIGIEVFGRSPEDMTEDCSLVRKQAGEVRRRLEQYATGIDGDREIRIELPLGSYVPLFHFSAAMRPVEASPSLESAEQVSRPLTHAQENVRNPNWYLRYSCAAAVVLLVASIFSAVLFWRGHRDPYPLATSFWEPLHINTEPVLVCIAKPIVYLPTYEYYQRYSLTHGGDFGRDWQRLNRRLPKDIDMAPRWSDMRVQEDYGVSRGDSAAAFLISSFFGRSGRHGELRIGPDCSITDLRSAPVVLVGVFNNRWTVDMMSPLHFNFIEAQDESAVSEQVAGGRTWKTEWNVRKNTSPWDAAADLQPIVDYAIVSRLRNSQTGKPMMIVAGISSPGTQAAAELVSTPEKLNQALKGIAPGWENRNIQLVLRVPVPNGTTPNASQVVASYSW
jgi:hypothetical protein